jgi:hypothetical protein
LVLYILKLIIIILLPFLVTIFLKKNLNLYYLSHSNILNFKNILFNIKLKIINHMSFLTKYYHRNELIWVDGFLFDFLQKKSVDKWIRKFVIYTGFIFSERLVFEYVVYIYLNNIIWPLHYLSILEPRNVVEMLTIIIWSYFILFTIFTLVLIIWI